MECHQQSSPRAIASSCTKHASNIAVDSCAVLKHTMLCSLPLKEHSTCGDASHFNVVEYSTRGPLRGRECRQVLVRGAQGQAVRQLARRVRVQRGSRFLLKYYHF